MPIKIQKNIPLAKYTTFKIGGPARYFCAAKNTDEVKEAFEFAEKNKLKVFILGGGSNLLVSDNGFNGLVIKLQVTSYKLQDNKIICGAGLSLAKLVNESAKADLTGMEWAAGIPGTVGGAVCNNAGAFGKCMGDVIKEAEVIEIGNCPPVADQTDVQELKKPSKLSFPRRRESSKQAIYFANWIPVFTGMTVLRQSGKLGNWEIWKLGKMENGKWKMKNEKLSNKECKFLYRDSVFKQDKKHIILSAVLKLKKGNEKESREKISKYLKSRAEKQPLQYPSAGSVFKNPVVDKKHFKSLIKRYPELESAAIKDTLKNDQKTSFKKLSLAYLLDSRFRGNDKNGVFQTFLKRDPIPAAVKYIIPAGWLIETLGLKGKKIGGAMISEKHGNFIVNAGNAKAEDAIILISIIKQKVRNNFGIQLSEEIEYVGF